jgi:hypothetical protein
LGQQHHSQSHERKTIHSILLYGITLLQTSTVTPYILFLTHKDVSSPEVRIPRPINKKRRIKKKKPRKRPKNSSKKLNLKLSNKLNPRPMPKRSLRLSIL